MHRDFSLTIDLEGRPTYVNPAALSVAGYDLEEARRINVFDLLTEASRPLARRMLERRLAGDQQPWIFEVEWVTRQGRIIPVEVNSTLIRENDQPIGVLIIARDLTHRREFQEKQRKMEDQIRQVQKLESLGILAGGIAHDFNNLLVGILGNADLALLDLPPTHPARGYLKEIERASRRAADLCRQMLAYSGRGRFVVEKVNLTEIVQEMAKMLEVSVSKKAALCYQFDAQLPPILAEATQIRQIVMNLITNASEALGSDNGVIRLTTGVMDCDAEYLMSTYLSDPLPPGRYVYLEVSDTGCGMDPETLKKIFDPFFTTKFTGRGLGLAAILGIVRGHHGTIKVYSEPGKGSTFKVLFPALSEEAADREGVKQKTKAPFKGEGAVLLVDDDETVRRVGKLMLERLGFEVILAADGQEAVERYANGHHRIRCILLDLTMPRLDGEECFRELARIGNDVRIIITSGYNEEEVTSRFTGKGLAGFMQKPFSIEMLQETLKRVLGQG